VIHQNYTRTMRTPAPAGMVDLGIRGTLAVHPNTPLCTEDPDLWFSTNRADKAKAESICLDCPLMQECREYGKTQEYGIWGGVEAGSGLIDPERFCEKGLHRLVEVGVFEPGTRKCRACRRIADAAGKRRRRAMKKQSSVSTAA
jgi:hypothetical protein